MQISELCEKCHKNILRFREKQTVYILKIREILISSSNGQVFLAVVHSLDELPDSEMEKIELFEKLPENLTYPNVSPMLCEEAYKKLVSIKEKV